ncbi:hypothetical protein [Lysinibacillus fusiformis]|uniref:hypothetical protein n=1 Tax=Lysinibacillus fusiformis TaxID=28031 RepID=UPI00263AD89B|nr:hypothetical protein [Lysinibacillus fusiformis]MDC6267332.1 hypothetical protein [Lysinibacillus sphaericus]MDN4968234.1 hypothetical protein [Lysinibacillus fusiformis]MDN4968408.1 hypothetical protein [Lysinibacillus fusiformis]
MIYNQITPMQFITFYYNGNDLNKVKQAKERKLQMTRKIRYANPINEIRDDQMEILSDTESHLAAITKDGLIVMFENNISK